MGFPIRDRLTSNEQARFHNLLKLAKESPFQGERDNAFAAATRLAARRGLTLDEAAARSAPPPPAQPQQATATTRDFAAFVHMTDYQIHLDKRRRDAALAAAQERGLDRDRMMAQQRRQGGGPRVRRSNARMDPHKHAWALVRETRLSYREIARITGIDIYQVVLMKIQVLRAA